MDPNTGAKPQQKELSDIYCYKNKNKEGEFYPRGGGKGVLQDAQGIFQDLKFSIPGFFSVGIEILPSIFWVA